MSSLSMQELVDFELPEGPDLEMYRAAARGDAEKVERMLNEGVDIEFTLFGWTPLMVACSKGHMWGRNGNSHRHFDLTAPEDDETFSEAEPHSSWNDVVRLLLQRGSLIEACDAGEKGRKRPLHLACQQGGYQGASDIVETLLENNAEIEAESDDEWRPLHYAVFFGHLEIVKLLLKHGADPSPLTIMGKTPLIIAKEKRMKAELYEEKYAKILQRNAIIELLEKLPQVESEFVYVLEDYYPGNYSEDVNWYNRRFGMIKQ